MTSLASALIPQYLTCLTTSRSQTDKLAFDVGLREHATGKSTHPRSVDQWDLGLGGLEKEAGCKSFGIPHQPGQEIGLIELCRRIIIKNIIGMQNENIGMQNEGEHEALTTVCQSLKEKQFLGVDTENSREVIPHKNQW